MPSDVPEGFAIADLIENLTQGLIEASSRVKEEARDPVVELTECEIELAVSATYRGSAGLKFWVISASGGADSKSDGKVRLRFRPAEGSVAQQFIQRDSNETDGPIPPKKQR